MADRFPPENPESQMMHTLSRSTGRAQTILAPIPIRTSHDFASDAIAADDLLRRLDGLGTPRSSKRLSREQMPKALSPAASRSGSPPPPMPIAKDVDKAPRGTPGDPVSRTRSRSRSTGLVLGNVAKLLPAESVQNPSWLLARCIRRTVNTLTRPLYTTQAPLCCRNNCTLSPPLRTTHTNVAPLLPPASSRIRLRRAGPATRLRSTLRLSPLLELPLPLQAGRVISNAGAA